ncbi:MAG: ABC transporter permease [Gemmatimonadetes bacterium]|nr:ABC transporter permease [Gemmatimonadota bacterium]
MLAELWSDLRYRARALFRRARMDQELEEELHFHLDRETEALVARGLPRAEAMRQARIAFGGAAQVREASREGRGLVLLEQLGQDLRYTLRTLGRAPAFTAAVVLTLGLGLGANAAMFGVVDRLLFRSPPFLHAPERTHRVYLASMDRSEEGVDVMAGYTRYLDLRRGTTTLAGLAAVSYRPLPVGTGLEAEELPVGAVSASLFDFFDATPALGRFFTAQEDTVPLGAMVAVLGHGFWQARYGGRPDVLGQAIQVGTGTYTIIGVAPKGFVGTAEDTPPVLFVPITAYAGTFRAGPNVSSYYTRYNWSWLAIVAQRKPGVSAEQATADLTRAYRESWGAELALSGSGPGVELARPRVILGPPQEERGPRRSTVAQVATWVSGVAAVVLLVASANVGNLLLARALRRRREMALRLALGVGRARLARQLLTESLVLSLLGCGAGLLVAQWGGALLGSLFLPPGTGGGALTDARTLGFGVGAALVAGTLAGLAPILQTRRTDLTEALKAGAREGGPQRSRLRTGLLLLQAGLSVVLLVGAGLFVRSLLNVRALRLGYDVEPVLYVYPNLRGARLDSAQSTALRLRLVEAARAVPGVEGAAQGLTVPFWDTWADDLFVEGIDSVARLGSFTLQAGSPDYFRVAGTRILRGRGFSEEDRQGAPPVVVVSQTMARTLWPGQEALGKCLRMAKPDAPCLSVVGIAEDIKQNSLTADGGRHYYLPIAQYHPEAAVLFARSRGAAVELAETLRRHLQPLMPGDAYVTVTPMADIVGPGMRSWQLGATMFVAFGGLALLLVGVGLYAVIAYDVAQRRHELGVRVALGARRGDLLRLVIRQGVVVALSGALLGALAALWAAPWIAPLLFEQPARDPAIYLTVGAILLGVAVLASALPAWRATLADPASALRAE